MLPVIGARCETPGAARPLPGAAIRGRGDALRIGGTQRRRYQWLRATRTARRGPLAGVDRRRRMERG